MKYIDAERLKAEIERLYEGEAPSHDQQCEFEDGYFTGIATISKFIDSLQQEQQEDPWQRARIAARTLNKMDLGIKFYGNLFPYLRKRGKLEGYCMKGTIGKKQPVWLYDTEGIAFLVKNGMLNYSPKN